MRVILYEPTDEEKRMIEERVLRMIDCLQGLSVEQKAFAMKVLADGFVKMTGIEGISIERKGS